jgi:hypothetical protein
MIHSVGNSARDEQQGDADYDAADHFSFGYALTLDIHN